jgi:hypothetical protein
MSVERNHCPAHIINNVCQFLAARQQIGSQDRADRLLDKIVKMSQALAEAYHILDCWVQFAQCK